MFGLLATAGAFALHLACTSAAPTVSSGYATCYDHPYPHNYADMRPVACLPSNGGKRSLQASAAAPVRTVQQGAPVLPPPEPTADLFNFIFLNCTAPAGQRKDYCEAVQRAFQQLSSVLVGIFDIKVPINVAIDIKPYDGSRNQPLGALAGAAPARDMPLVSADGQTRMYPAALVKQFGIADVTYADADVSVFVNSNVFNNSIMQFPGDPLPPPGSNVTDFGAIVLHEILHGLGFLSYFQYESIRGQPCYHAAILGNDDGQDATFVDAVFDKFTPAKSSATIAGNAQLFPGNTIQQGSSSQYLVGQAFDTCTSLAQQVVTPLAFPFNADNGLSAYLETSLSPFKLGSTGAHLDYKTYAYGPDFLMVYKASSDGTLAQVVAKRNHLLSNDQINDPVALASIDLRQALGPRTLSIMQALGWTIRGTAVPAPGPSQRYRTKVPSYNDDNVQW